MNDESAVKRILDANCNRAREALRVAEDYARYGLDFAPAAHAIKELRHELRAVMQSLGDDLCLWRGVEGDVGREDNLPTEMVRPDALAVARASFARLQQALRSLEEFTKVVQPNSADALQRLRYRSYDLEQQVVARARPLEVLARHRFMVLLTRRFALDRPHEEVAEAALAGGADMIQLREKEMSDGDVLQLARKLRRVTDRHGAMLIINDRPDLAALVNADGVHLGRGDLPAAEARRIMGPGRAVGASTHSPEEAHAAIAEGADYIALGQIFESPTKDTGKLAGLEYIRWAAENVKLPTLAIGGITAENVAEVIGAGAGGIAVCSAVIGAPDVQAAARKIREKLDLARAAKQRP